ncbi:hypothetical protein IJG79_01600 [Candidatus Saccharibacteria bacterium]|nr:hypothetical protein [Candidatus Saccharibacteria bacterium]
MSNSSMPEFGKSSKAQAEEEPKSYGPPVFSDDPFSSTPTPNTIQTFRDHQINGEQFDTSSTSTISEFSNIPSARATTAEDTENTPPDLSEQILSDKKPAKHSSRKSSRFHKSESHKDTNKAEKPAAVNLTSKKSRKLSFIISHKSANNDSGPNLKTICIILGACALIASAVAVWALINRNPNNNPNNLSSISTAEGSLAAKTLGFYPQKIANSSDGYNYRLEASKVNAGGNKVIDAYISNDNNSISIDVYWNYVKDYYGIVTSKTERETFTLEYDTPVSDITIAESSKSPSGDAIIVLLSNGTIQYIPILMSLQSKTFQTSGQLNGVANVVKFYHVLVTSKGTNDTGFTTIIAQKNDGTLFDLQYLLKSATGQN